MQHIVIAGGTGLVGRRLTEMLIEKKYTVTILTRNKNTISTHPQITYSYWNIDNQEIDVSILQNTGVIINLAGESVVAKRWTTRQKQNIINSRVNSGKLIVTTLEKHPNTVTTIINASAIGWYKPYELQNFTTNQYQEEEEENNTDFLGNTCKLWEQSIDAVTNLNKRLIKLRIGIVFSKKGGAIPEFLKPIKWRVAAILGNQKISWIHIDDLCNIIITAVENKNYEGVYNAVAPTICTNKELNIALAKKKNGKWFVPITVPNFLIKMLLGEMSVEVLKSSTISCKKLLDMGFVFKYKNITEAIDDIL